MLWEYAVKSAVSHSELSEHEGHQVLQCWQEAEQLQDNAEKNAKFKKLLGMKFGPSKGNTVHELVGVIFIYQCEHRNSISHNFKI